MRAKVSMQYLGSSTRTFKNDKGETVEFTRCKFFNPADLETPELGVHGSVDMTGLSAGSLVHVLCDFRFNERTRSFTGKVVKLYEDEDEMANDSAMCSQSELEQA